MTQTARVPNAPKTPLRSFRVPEAVYRAAQVKAAERGETLSEVVRKALEQYAKLKRGDMPPNADLSLSDDASRCRCGRRLVRDEDAHDVCVYCRYVSFVCKCDDLSDDARPSS